MQTAIAKKTLLYILTILASRAKAHYRVYICHPANITSLSEPHSNPVGPFIDSHQCSTNLLFGSLKYVTVEIFLY